MRVPSDQNVQTLGGVGAANAERTPDALAVVDPAGGATWSEVDRNANRIANGLLAVGLAPGDRVASIVYNSRDSLALVLGIAKAGLVSVPLNFGLTERELSFLIDDAAPQAIVVHNDLLENCRGSIENRNRVFVIGDEGSAGFASPFASFAELTALASDVPPAAEVSPDALRTMRYTSGTTSAPKGCMSTHRQTLASVDNFLREVPAIGTGAYLAALPLFTGVGIWMTICAARAGQPTVMLRSFDPATMLRYIGDFDVGHTFVVPTMLSRLCDEFEVGAYDCSSLQLIGYGGSPMPRPLIERALSVLPCRFYQGYGGGEMGGFIAYLQPEDHESLHDEAIQHRIKSVGRPAAYATVRIVDDDGNQLPTGALGEIAVNSASNFSGYWRRPEETAATIRDGWVNTGDAGYFDDDGYLYVVDRKKDIVLTGGMNVSSAEVEEVAMQHPGVAGAAVVGLPDEEWGEAVTAAVIRRPDALVTEDELRQFMRARLAGYKTPKRVVFVESFPLNSAGKIVKRELKAILSGEQAEA